MATPTQNSVSTTVISQPADSNIAALVDAIKWGGPVGEGVELTYSFPNSASTFVSNYSPDDEPGQFDASINIYPLSTNEQQAFEQALDVWANVANISFVRVDDNATTVGEIRATESDAVARDSVGEFFTLAWAYVPGDLPASGDVWLNPEVFDGFNSIEKGSNNFLTLIHEIGHALNLNHPFDPGFDWDVDLPTGSDHIFNTVMSYTEDPTGNDYLASRYPTTPMVLDIQAMQYIYGANNSYETGDNTYTYSDTGEYFETIWDAGGTDTIVYTGSANGNIDLREGKSSSLGVPVDLMDPATSLVRDQVDTTVWIAIDAEIENATGNEGDNEISGNSLDNELRGNGGNDLEKGRGGNDRLFGGDGNDQLKGGGGDDTIVGNKDEDTLAGGKGNDILKSGADNDSLRGGGGDDILKGGGGNDELHGGGGSDEMKGGKGDDSIRFDPNDQGVINGGKGVDTLNFVSADQFLDLREFDANQYRSLEQIDLTGAGNNTLQFELGDAEDLANELNAFINNGTEQVLISGNAGDEVISSGQGWTQGSDVQIGSEFYSSYTHADNDVQLLIDTDITQTIS